MSKNNLPAMIHHYAAGREKLGALMERWEDSLGDELSEPQAYKAVKAQEKKVEAAWAKVSRVLGIGV